MNMRISILLLCSLCSGVYAMNDNVQSVPNRVSSPLADQSFLIQNDTEWPISVNYTDEQQKNIMLLYLKGGETKSIPFQLVQQIVAISPISSYGVAGDYANGLSAAIGGFASRWGWANSVCYIAENTKRYCSAPRPVDLKFVNVLFDGLKQSLLSRTAKEAHMRIMQQYDEEKKENILDISCDQVLCNNQLPGEYDSEKVPQAVIYSRSETQEQRLCDKCREFFAHSKEIKLGIAQQLAAARVLAEMVDQCSERTRKLQLIRTALNYGCDVLRIQENSFDARIERALDDHYVDSLGDAWESCIDVVQEAMDNPSIAALMHQEDIEAFAKTSEEIIHLIHETAIFVEDLVYKHQELLQLSPMSVNNE